MPAPVCPAVTTASASPFLTSSAATRIEASFFSRIASAGLCSSMSMTEPAWTMRMFAGSSPARSLIVSVSPTRISSTFGCARA